MMITSIAVMHIPSYLMSRWSRVARIIGALGVAAALVACSAIKLGYNTLGDVSYWWLDSYIDFTDEQAPRAREDLARLHVWHRQQELPRFTAMLQNLEQLAPQDITASQACTVVAQARERIEAIALRAEPAVVTLAMDMAPEQLTHLQRKYNDNNAKYRKEWIRLSPAEQRDKRFTEYLDRSEMIYGKLDDVQRAVLRRQIEQSIFDPARVLAERQRRQQDVLQTLRKVAGQKIGLDDARKLVRGYIDRVREPPDAGQRAYQKSLLDESCRTFAALHASTTPAQRESAVRRLRAYQRDVKELSAQP
jgi:hypothetical protein